MSDSKHCTDPETCTTNKERLRDMEQITNAYNESQKAYEATNRKLDSTNNELVKQTAEIRGLADSVKEYKTDTEHDFDIVAQDQKALHSRVTNLALETTQELGKIRTDFAKREGELKVGQATTKGALKGKVDWAEIIKLTFLMGSLLGIFKYVLPAVGG